MKKSVEWQSMANKAIYASAFVVLVFAFAITLQGPTGFPDDQPLGAPRGTIIPTTTPGAIGTTLPPSTTLPKVTGLPEVPYTQPTQTTILEPKRGISWFSRTLEDFWEELKRSLTLKAEIPEEENQLTGEEEAGKLSEREIEKLKEAGLNDEAIKAFEERRIKESPEKTKEIIEKIEKGELSGIDISFELENLEITPEDKKKIINAWDKYVEGLGPIDKIIKILEGLSRMF